MATKIAVANHKGGVGKTTSALHLAWRAADLGLRVLAIDADGQGNLSIDLAGFDFLQDVPEDVTLSCELFNDDCDVRPYTGNDRGIHVIPSRANDRATFEVERLDIGVAAVPAANITPIEDQYDVIIYDCPPGLGNLMIAGIVMCDYVALPVQLNAYAVWGASGMLATLDGLSEEVNTNIELLGMYVSRYNQRSDLDKEVMQQLRDGLGDRLLTTAIGARAAIDRAVTFGIPVWELRDGAAQVAGREMLGVVDELLERAGLDIPKLKAERRKRQRAEARARKADKDRAS